MDHCAWQFYKMYLEVLNLVFATYWYLKQYLLTLHFDDIFSFSIQMYKMLALNIHHMYMKWVKIGASHSKNTGFDFCLYFLWFGINFNFLWSMLHFVHTCSTRSCTIVNYMIYCCPTSLRTDDFVLAVKSI